MTDEQKAAAVLDATTEWIDDRFRQQTQQAADEIPTWGCTNCGATNLDPPCDCADKYSLQST